MSQPRCPTDEQLARLAQGRIDERLSEQLISHIEHCEECEQTVAALDSASDTVLSQLRSPAAPPAQPEDYEQAAAAVKQYRRDAALPEPAHAKAAEPPAPLGQLREYQLLEKLGEGGMGAVYKALHKRLKKVVAVKVLPAGRLENDAALSRFEREMEAVGQVDHPNIVRATDAGEHEGTHFLVMEHVQGIDLSKLIKATGPIPVADACELIRQAAVGLQHAHQQGMVHRDIKPSNLMLTPQGRVKILDMGLALLAEHHSPVEQQLTTTGQMMGTLDYMAPEQGSDSHIVDGRADIYSLGASLYKLLAGEAPFGGERFDTPVKKMMALATEVPEPVRDRRPDVPDELSTLVARMIAKSPDARPATAGEIAELLAPFCAGSDLPNLLNQSRSGTADVVSPSVSSTASHLSSAMTGTQPTVAAPRRAASSGGARRRWPLLFVAAGLAGVVLLGAIIIKIRRPDGSEATVKVPDKSKVVIGEDGSVEVDLAKLPRARIDQPPTRAEEPASITPDYRPAIAGSDNALLFNYLNAGKSYVTVPSLKRTGGEALCVEGFVTIRRHKPELFFTPFGFPFDFGIKLQEVWHVNVQHGNRNFKTSSNQAVQLGKRTHLAAVHDGGRVRLYIDGRRVAESQLKVDLRPPGNRPFFIGLILEGIVDEVRVSKVVRYDADFEPADRFTPDKHTLALYHFDEGQGDVLHDSSGNNHHGRIVGAKWVRAGSAASAAPPLAIAPFDAEQAKQHQQSWADYLGLPVEKEAELPGGAKMTFMLIPPGEFMMGADDRQHKQILDLVGGDAVAAGTLWMKFEHPRHRVRITRPFYFSKHQLTQTEKLAC